MTRLDITGTIHEPVDNYVGPGAADDRVLSSGELQVRRSCWDDIIDRQLIEWASDPLQLEEEGIEAPSRPIISQACSVARSMRDAGVPAPLRAVPNGEGGIVFEWKDGSVFETIEIDKDGVIEHAHFVDSRLVSRQRLR